MKENIKIGARILSYEALEKLLPSYENIFKQIESIRSMAYDVHKVEQERNKNKSYINKYKEFDTQYNNVFSVLGGRGSGKTSALLTIKHKIMNKNSQDIILPLIVPENMGENSDVLGWLFAQFEKEVNNLERILKRNNGNTKKLDSLSNANEYFEECRLKEKTLLSKKFDELIKHYTFINSDYREIMLNQYDTLNSYVKNSKNILAPEDELVIKFEEFINELLIVKKACNEIEGMTVYNEERQKALIFVFFDDVDLSNYRCEEVLNVILRYLSNSNIVVFVAGDYDTFSEILTINNLDKYKLLKIDLDTEFYNGKTCLEVRQALTKDILKKVMPPALRYYMPILTNKAKSEFVYSTEDTKKNTNYLTLKELILQKFIIENDENSIKDKSFFYYNGQLIEDYFLIFDENARGLMNVYYFLNNLEFSKFPGEDKSYEEKEFCNSLKDFLNVIIESSSVFSLYRDTIEKIIDLKENLEYSFINYNYINDLVKSNIIENEEDKLRIFILSNFMENLLNLKYYKLNERYKKTHGGNILNNILNSELYPRNEDVQLNLLLHSLLSSVLPKKIKFSINDESDYFTNIYFQQLNKLVKDNEKVNGEYSYFLMEISRKDPEWVRKILKKIMNETGDISVILENTMAKTEIEYQVIYSYNEIKENISSSDNKMKLKQEIEDNLFIKRGNIFKFKTMRYAEIDKFRAKLEEAIGELNIMKRDIESIQNEYEILNSIESRYQFVEMFTIKNIKSKLPSDIFTFIDDILQKGYLTNKQYKELKYIYYENKEEKKIASSVQRSRFLNFIKNNIIENIRSIDINRTLIGYREEDIIENLEKYIVLKITIEYLESGSRREKNEIRIIKDSLNSFLREDNKNNKAFRKLLSKEMGK